MANTVKVIVFHPGSSMRQWSSERCSLGECVHTIVPAKSTYTEADTLAMNLVSIDAFCRQAANTDRLLLPATELDVQIALWGSILHLPSDGVLRAACRYPGNVASLARCVQELALHQLDAKSLMNIAVQLPNATAKLSEIAEIYQRVRAALRVQGLSLQGDLWQNTADNISRVVHGTEQSICFAEFFRAPYALCSLINACTNHSQVYILLEGDLDNPISSGSIRTMLSDLDEYITYDVEHINAEKPTCISQWLARNLGLPAPDTDIPDDGEVFVIDAPSPLQEATLIVRELVKRHRNGSDWSDMCVVLPNMQEALPMYQLVLEKYQVPYQQNGSSLLDDPQVYLLVILLRSISQFSRDDALQLLRISVFQSDIYELERLRREGKSRGVQSGLSLLQLPSATEVSAWSDTLQVTCQRVCQAVLQLQSAISASEVVTILREIAEHWALITADDQSSAVARFLEITTVFFTSTELQPAELYVPVQQLMVLSHNAAPIIEDAVKVLQHMSALSEPLAFVAMTGLLEGTVPGSSREDALINDDQRRTIAEMLHRRMTLSHEDTDIDRLYFARGIAKASSVIWLSCSRMVGDREALPSYLLVDTTKLLPRGRYTYIERRLFDTSYSITEMVAENEWKVRLAERLFGREKETRSEISIDELKLLVALAKRGMGLVDEGMQQWPEWSIWPTIPKLEKQESRPMIRDFTATEIQQMLQCRFRHYARWLLGLRLGETSVMTMQGRWLHEVMRIALTQHQDDVATLLKEVSEQQPADLHHGEHELLFEDTGTLCESMLQREHNIYSQFELTPKHFELVFGHGDEPGAPTASINQIEVKPLLFPLNEGHLRIAGRLDRVDVCRNTGLAVLIDYKRSVARDWFDKIAQGEDIQIPIYISALQNLFALKVGAVAIDSGKTDARYRIIIAPNTDQEFQQRLWQRSEEGAVSRIGSDLWWRMMYQNLSSRLKQSASMLAEGDILPIPGDWCSGCSYQHFCRTQQGAHGAVHDGQAYPLLGELP